MLIINKCSVISEKKMYKFRHTCFRFFCILQICKTIFLYYVHLNEADIQLCERKKKWID